MAFACSVVAGGEVAFACSVAAGGGGSTDPISAFVAAMLTFFVHDLILMLLFLVPILPMFALESLLLHFSSEADDWQTCWMCLQYCTVTTAL